MAATGMSALSSIGMSVEGATGNFGSDLANQSAAESEDERKRRLEQERQSRLMGGGTGSAALASTFGGYAAVGSIGGMGMGRFGL
jgi:hypothetical protein